MEQVSYVEALRNECLILPGKSEKKEGLLKVRIRRQGHENKIA